MTDYMVMEAVTLKVQAEDERERKKKEREDWKKDRKHLQTQG